jgi:hypothetical protein
VASCTGTETTNPLTKFDGSGCLEAVEANEAALIALPLTVADDAGAAVGGSEIGVREQCVVYSLHEDVLHVGLENFPGRCGIDWLGRASFEDGALVLQGMDDAAEGCLVSRCGSCTYDLDFEVSGVELASRSDDDGGSGAGGTAGVIAGSGGTEHAGAVLRLMY